MEQTRKRTVQDQIHAVQALLRAWDPIGVYSDPDDSDIPLDEYDSYAPVVLGKLQACSEVEVLTQHLNSLVTTRMGMGSDIEHCRVHARILVAWWNAHGDKP